jgi:hypothetical protein
VFQTVGRDGHVLQIKLISGHPMLVGAAMDAVKQWEYKPTQLNGSPVEVVMQVNLAFVAHASACRVGTRADAGVDGISDIGEKSPKRRHECRRRKLKRVVKNR